MSLRDLFCVGTKLWKIYSRATTKSIPLLQPDYGFCQKNGPERVQVEGWYPNESGGPRLVECYCVIVLLLYYYCIVR